MTEALANANRTRRLALLMLAGSVLPLGAALFSQHALGLPPCHFCLLQRWPYLAVFAAGIALMLFPHPTRVQLRTLLMLALLGWLTTGLIGLYHTGIERGWVAYSGGCVANTEMALTLDDVRDQILAAPAVSCGDAIASFLGLSMASWNALTAAALILTAFWLYKRP